MLEAPDTPLTRPTSVLERFALQDWRAVTGLFLASNLLENMAQGHLTAFTPLFLRDELRLPADQVGPWTGFLAALTFLVAFPLAPFWGALAERYSRKLIIVRSQYLEALGYILCCFAPSLPWFIAARLLLGFTYGNVAIIIAAQTLLTPERRMASAISVVQAAQPIAASLGPPMGVLLLHSLGLRGMFLLDAAICLAAALMVTFLMPEPPGRNRSTPVMANMRSSFDTVWHAPAVRLNFIAWFLTRSAMSTVDSYLPVRIADLVRPDPAPAIGLILGIYGGLTTIATWITGRIVDRVGPTRLFWPAMVAAAITVAATALSPWLWLLAAAAWLRSVPVALTGTVLYAHLALVLRRDQRAPVMSITPAPRNLAAFVLPLIAAGAAFLGSGGALLVAAAGYGLAAWVGLRLSSATRPRSST